MFVFAAVAPAVVAWSACSAIAAAAEGNIHDAVVSVMPAPVQMVLGLAGSAEKPIREFAAQRARIAELERRLRAAEGA